MENIFIKTVQYENGKNELKTRLAINYVEINNMMKSLNRVIATSDEYHQWVIDWKKYEANLVSAIQAFRKERIRAKNTIKNSGILLHANTPSSFQNLKLNLRPFARELYKLRSENKALYKSGAFKKITEAA